jgi:hypothetical protein
MTLVQFVAIVEDKRKKAKTHTKPPRHEGMKRKWRGTRSLLSLRLRAFVCIRNRPDMENSHEATKARRDEEEMERNPLAAFFASSCLRVPQKQL